VTLPVVLVCISVKLAMLYRGANELIQIRARNMRERVNRNRKSSVICQFNPNFHVHTLPLVL